MRHGSRFPAPRAAVSVLAVVACLTIAVPASGGAAQSRSANRLAPAVVPGAEVSDAKLRQFAAVAAEVEAIRQEYATEVQSLQESAEARIVASVQDSGLTVDEFRTIFETVQADPELARRLESLERP